MTQRKSPFWRRSLVVVAMLSFGTAAAATVAGRYIPTASEEAQKSVSIARTPSPTPAPREVLPTVAPLPVPEQEAKPLTPVTPKRTIIPVVRPPAREPKSLPPASPGHATLIVEATQALRLEHSPSQALVLVRRYVVAAPDGALLEEAYGLALEASQSQPKAERLRWVHEYLQRFPHGRFTSQAQRLLTLP